jgi:hypothetical protein
VTVTNLEFYFLFYSLQAGGNIKGKFRLKLRKTGHYKEISA